MRTVLLISTLLLLGMAILPSCGDGARQQAATSMEPINVVIVLDLSNRLVKTPGQAEKDKQAINAFLELFEAKQKRQAYIGSNDQLRIVIAPQPDVPTSTNDSLRIDMNDMKRPNRNMPSIGRPRFVKERERFSRNVDRIYREALQNPFTGADLYTFFCTELRSNFGVTEGKTKVIVLTDGYLQFDRQYLAGRPECTYMRRLDRMREEKDDWKAYFESRELALCPCQNANFSGMEVMMLETAPLFKGSSVYEFPMIEHYWMTWFNAMGVPAQIEPHDNMVSGIRDKAKAFLER